MGEDVGRARAAVDWTAADAARFLRRATTSDDKYSRGVVGMRTGSESFPGAAVLGVEAAWRTGVGMVRYVGPRRAADLVLARRPETVTVDGRVQAWVLGSGTDAASRADDESEALRAILAGPVPVVVDAGALDLAPGSSAPIVVTPHASEFAKLRKSLGLPEDAGDDREAAAFETAAALDGAVLLKGATTIVATPSGWSARITSGTAWLATAGTGDVLGGVLGAILAAADEPDIEALGRLAATAAWVHGRAGAIAAGRHGDDATPITALDVAEALPETIAGLLAAAS